MALSDMPFVNQLALRKAKIVVTPTVMHRAGEALGLPERPRRGIKESVELIHATKSLPVISAPLYYCLLKAIQRHQSE